MDALLLVSDLVSGAAILRRSCRVHVFVCVCMCVWAHQLSSVRRVQQAGNCLQTSLLPAASKAAS